MGHRSCPTVMLFSTARPASRNSLTLIQPNFLLVFEKFYHRVLCLDCQRHAVYKTQVGSNFAYIYVYLDKTPKSVCLSPILVKRVTHCQKKFVWSVCLFQFLVTPLRVTHWSKFNDSTPFWPSGLLDPLNLAPLAHLSHVLATSASKRFNSEIQSLSWRRDRKRCTSFSRLYLSTQ